MTLLLPDIPTSPFRRLTCAVRGRIVTHCDQFDVAISCYIRVYLSGIERLSNLLLNPSFESAKFSESVKFL